ncbi:BTAD domain-containing putative transcriptional regulator [Arthrobacter sp. CG_A4]|uniref:BTAD domain-containing putative transcriptional regulator n=1 Tax=Arthrobacter sp. CG_A4 TaxID=3071706 RepID=UPI002E0A3899|nr:DNA-binding NarL/FixJ family response regulator/DNA-binding SARP family transcriptional activator [Arthrobacter sp. CG_A4]
MLSILPPENAGPSTVSVDLRTQGILDIRILGPLRIRRGGAVLESGGLGGPKPRQILEILLLNLGMPVSKDRLIEVLWAGRPPAEALPTLESYVSVLRRHLQPGQGKAGPLRTVSGGYMMDSLLVDLDVSRFNDLLRRASTCGATEALELLQEALELASAPLLGDELRASWADEERRNHELRVCRARVLAAELAMSLHQHDTAVAWAREALSGDELNERAWSSLVLGLEASGQPLEALRAFEQYRRTLEREMGCSPGDALRAVHARLLRLTGDAGRPAPATALAPVGGTSALGAQNAGPAARTAIRILTVDDHRTFAELLTGALDREPDLHSVGSAASVEDAVRMCRDLAPDVVVMDYHLPDGDGLGAAIRILEYAPETRIIMLTGDPSQDVLRQAAGIGICGFLPKDGSLAAVLDTLRHARAGNMVVHPSLVAQIGVPHQASAGPPAGPPLSPRELDVLRLMAEGHEIRAVAHSLNISIHTCRGHVKTIFSKLGTHSQREAMAEAQLRGILSAKSNVQAF